jgi:hypothetical protein
MSLSHWFSKVINARSGGASVTRPSLRKPRTALGLPSGIALSSERVKASLLYHIRRRRSMFNRAECLSKFRGTTVQFGAEVLFSLQRTWGTKISEYSQLAMGAILSDYCGSYQFGDCVFCLLQTSTIL